jgi:hypothetical protein
MSIHVPGGLGSDGRDSDRDSGAGVADATATSRAGERLYLVCVHYPLRQGEDQDWEQVGQRLIVHDSAVQRLAEDIRYLRQVLRPRTVADRITWRGFAFIFLDLGWTRVLGGGQPAHMAFLGGELANTQNYIEQSLARNAHLRGAPDPRCERIVTAKDMLQLLELLEIAAGRSEDQSASKLFAGQAKTMRYDAPKIIEAAIRIANIGCGVPLFRFDDDVLFYGHRLPGISFKARREQADRAAKSLLRLCDRYKVAMEDSRIRYFVFSGGYDAPQSIGASTDNDPRIFNGYATRVVQVAQLPEKRNKDTEDSSKAVVKGSVSKAFLDTLVEIGANSERQVVSGAGFCLSDGAILDLPPFSNMHLNVMWIDDHLKYALHDELGHFGRWTRTHHRAVARVRKATFSQLRHPSREGDPLVTYRDIKWHLGTYMLRLVLGSVADFWLRARMELKQETGVLSKEEYQTVVRSVPSPYAAWFMEALPAGWDPSADNPVMDAVRQKLWEQALMRLKRAVEIWSEPAFDQTFLGLFVKGSSHPKFREFKDFLPVGMPRGLREAVKGLPSRYEKAGRPPENPARDDLQLEEALVTLLDDFLYYVKVVQFWPFFVQSVRNLQNQHARYPNPALEWMFPLRAQPRPHDKATAPAAP